MGNCAVPRLDENEIKIVNYSSSRFVQLRNITDSSILQKRQSNYIANFYRLHCPIDKFTTIESCDDFSIDLGRFVEQNNISQEEDYSCFSDLYSATEDQIGKERRAYKPQSLVITMKSLNTIP